MACIHIANEIFLKKYIGSEDRRTTGPKSSTGEIFNQLNFDPKQLPLVDFSPLKDKMTELPNLDQFDFICNSQSGTLNHARWLTTANQILRLYISSSQPSKNLKRISSFILNFYAPSWFKIKSMKIKLDMSRWIAKFSVYVKIISGLKHKQSRNDKPGFNTKS